MTPDVSIPWNGVYSPVQEADLLRVQLPTHHETSPIRTTSIAEVKALIQHHTHPHKAPGHDLLTGTVLKELSPKDYRAITQIYNAVLRLRYFPRDWKMGHIIMIAKPGKNPNDVTSYRPISLLPLPSKVLEKILLRRILPLLEENGVIPKHQFGFRPKHGTIEQAHRLVHAILDDFEHLRYGTAAFLDISQAFDKVWHPGLWAKIQRILPLALYTLLTSYLSGRQFWVKYRGTYTPCYVIYSGVPQGNILGPILYSIYAADIPVMDTTLIATYADDTAILASHVDPVQAAELLQHLRILET